jgi:hypothetical protein
LSSWFRGLPIHLSITSKSACQAFTRYGMVLVLGLFPGRLPHLETLRFNASHQHVSGSVRAP